MDDDAYLHFHDELVSMLTSKPTNGTIVYPVNRKASIKDVIESLGPPHTEIYKIHINDTEVDFTYILNKKDVVEIYPAKKPVDVTQKTILRPMPLTKIKFITDVNVGKLARLMRLIGFDTTYNRAWDDTEIAEQSLATGRIVLSRDKNCLKRTKIIYGKWIRNNSPKEQLRTVIEEYGLWPAIKPFTRCILCNVPLRSVQKETIITYLQPLTKKYYNKFSQCPNCLQIYWEGTHYEEMKKFLENIKKNNK
jgi:uncharacterized protein with PIN domain